MIKIPRRHFLRTIALGDAGLSLLGHTRKLSTNKTKKTNIILIMAD
jgi:hypothetical protein